MAALLKILPHAVDVHVHPAIVLYAADVDRQRRILLADAGIGPRRLLQNIGRVSRRAVIHLFAADDADRARFVVNPIVGVDAAGAQHRQAIQRQRTAVAVCRRQPAQYDLPLRLQAESHRIVANQAPQALFNAHAAVQRRRLHAVELHLVEKYLHIGLLGEAQHGALQRLRRNVEMLLLCGLRAARVSLGGERHRRLSQHHRRQRGAYRRGQSAGRRGSLVNKHACVFHPKECQTK